ncbi:MAG: glycosyltransferase family 4 protein [Cytophagaceae bacterium]|jgi:glycosyltransferase involved in cell wall biosynthesis|nr:glycosyltransferase family 4 protein [Cytophagaceae bacterium]
MPNNRITLYVHLLNDFSGSPRVLANVINTGKNPESSWLLHSSDDGFLNEVSVEKRFTFPYRPSKNKILTFIFWLKAQCLIAFQIFKHRKNIDKVYVNTLLPAGAMWAAKLLDIPCCCHIHETSIQPAFFKKFLRLSVAVCCREVFFVSKDLAHREAFTRIPTQITYNKLSNDFFETANACKNHMDTFSKKRVTMICSNKRYKGIPEFMALAKKSSEFYFLLVLNDSERKTLEEKIPSNVEVRYNCTNIHEVYQQSSIVINLSHPEMWIETFGMTILEGLSYGLPCIVPQIGGIAELIDEGINGFHIDSRNAEALYECIKTLLNDEGKYMAMSKAAYEKAWHMQTQQAI